MSYGYFLAWQVRDKLIVFIEGLIPLNFRFDGLPN